MYAKAFRFLIFAKIAIVIIIALHAFAKRPEFSWRLPTFPGSPSPEPPAGEAPPSEPPAGDPPAGEQPPVDNGPPPPPEFYQWETTSYFNPIAQDIGNKTMEELCESFPTHLLHTIQPVLRMGHSEAHNKIKAQLQSVSACISNLIIFSDLDEPILNRTTYDILADLPASYRVDNPDFNNYLDMQELRKKGQLDVNAEATSQINGWILDKYKFLPMVERAWNINPRRKWYIFFETDTYVVWDNVFRFVENLDPDTPLYMGSPSPGRGGTWFANGGPGFILSRAAVLKLLKRKVGEEGDFLEPPLSHRWLDLLRGECCGDSVLGWALWNVGIHLNGYWPMFNPHPLHGVPFHDRYWCQPVLTLHKTSPEDMVGLWRWEHSRRQLGRPLLYKDLYEFKRPGHPSSVDDWDNADWDSFPGPPEITSFEACGQACNDHPDCFQWNWHLDRCLFVRSIRYGSKHKAEIDPGTEQKSNGTAWSQEERRFRSGWATDKIDRWRDDRKCEVVQWVRPSIKRIF